MGVTFNDATKKLLDGNNFPILATINADGSAQTSVLWAKRDGDRVVFATVRGRLKERNMARDPRVSVSVFDQENPYDYVEIRGTVEMTDEGGRELINELSHKYLGKDYPEEPADVVRVLVRITPTKITGNAA
ncbi:PPOX class F420-dependent oxidoreductase [Amycolatopsis keratiniphila]|uniref:PPOX class F420-dependent enzyme n=1 Tax=Amycolatopsis keratiniphila subsp. keratiniphila TaxID=227715 RepID=A0A1W2LNG5_9PSEU|nr:PPOX class F420-dependent oxidoreductase [Amycolatopsis keratiniphila]ONF64391.1 PPOX class F420-dependent enzyme [Amycolatopsis keratiniphila subsp. keratiniphila]